MAQLDTFLGDSPNPGALLFHRTVWGKMLNNSLNPVSSTLVLDETRACTFHPLFSNNTHTTLGHGHRETQMSLGSSVSLRTIQGLLTVIAKSGPGLTTLCA